VQVTPIHKHPIPIQRTMLQIQQVRRIFLLLHILPVRLPGSDEGVQAFRGVDDILSPEDSLLLLQVILASAQVHHLFPHVL